jgi:RNA polymerase sigma-70 factor (ECF subfamily)
LVLTMTTVPVSLEQRLQAGEQSALREVFDEYGPMVLGLCRRLVGAEAEDVAQQVFLDAWRSRARYDAERGSLGAWLARIARFKSIDHLRAAGRRPSVPSAEAGASTPQESEVDAVVDQLVVTTALAELPPARKEVVELGFYHGLTHPEIAEKLGLPLGTVKSHMRRGLEMLQRELEGSRGH